MSNSEAESAGDHDFHDQKDPQVLKELTTHQPSTSEFPDGSSSKDQEAREKIEELVEQTEDDDHEQSVEQKKIDQLEKAGELNQGDQKVVAADDDDEGFRTPTTLDHKIPVPERCPPAPKKPKASRSNKRKASNDCEQEVQRIRITLEDLASIFPPIDRHCSDIGHKNKKARGDDNA